MRRADGTTKKPSSQQPTGQPQSASAAASVQFTFINQHSDIKSVRDRRIQNADHRHEIRSHVMRNVRLTEHNQGYKRPTGRAPARIRSTDRKTSITSSSTASYDTGYDDSSSVKKDSTSPEDTLSPGSHSPLIIDTVSQLIPPLYLSPDRNAYLDPFHQTPGNSLNHYATEALLKYCFTTFMPVTFPVESKQTREQLSRRSLVLSAKISNPATFSGFLATVACHRAIMYKHHTDLSPSNNPTPNSITNPDYRKAHRDAILATRHKVDNDQIRDSDFLEACFSLISTTTIIGAFNEARRHLLSVQKVIDRVGISVEGAAWLPVADIKAALGTLDKPRVSLPWTRIPISQTELARMLPPVNSPLASASNGFDSITTLTPALRQLIRDAWVVCTMCDFNARDSEGLTGQEHVTFRCKGLELEHDLLKYVFECFPSQNHDYKSLLIPPFEDVVRLAILGLLCTVSVHVLPASGLGRAVSDHQMRAVRRWFRTMMNPTPNSPSQPQSSQPPIRPALSECKCVFWALFIFTHCAKEQHEAHQFKEMLSELANELWLMNWEEVEMTVYEFLYVPSVMKPDWMKVWNDVEDWRRRQAETPTSLGGLWGGRGAKE